MSVLKDGKEKKLKRGEAFKNEVSTIHSPGYI